MERILNFWEDFMREWRIDNTVDYGGGDIQCKRPEFYDFMNWLNENK